MQFEFSDPLQEASRIFRAPGTEGISRRTNPSSGRWRFVLVLILQMTL